MRDTPPACIYSGIAHHTSLFDRSIFGTRSALWSILQMPQNISGIFWQILAKTTTDWRRSQASRSTLEKTVLVNSLEFAAVTQWAKGTNPILLHGNMGFWEKRESRNYGTIDGRNRIEFFEKEIFSCIVRVNISRNTYSDSYLNIFLGFLLYIFVCAQWLYNKSNNN